MQACGNPGYVACENMSRLGGPNGLNSKEKQGGMGAVA